MMSLSWRRWGPRRQLFTLGLLVLTLGWAVRVPGSARVTGKYVRVPPAALAHLLADYSHRHDGGAWSIENETNNYTSWRYLVAYECGALCEGRVAVEAQEEPSAAGTPPRHGTHAAAHLVHVRDRRCRRLPLLPWPTFCEETEWSARVRSATDGGSVVEEEATVWCGALRVLRGKCARDLQEQLERRHQRLRLAARSA